MPSPRVGLVLGLLVALPACADAAAQPTLLEGCEPSDAGVDAPPEVPACDDSDVIVLLDRSSSMTEPADFLDRRTWLTLVAHPLRGWPTHFDVATRLVEWVQAGMAPGRTVQVIGFPAPPIEGVPPPPTPCTASEPATVEAMHKWLRPPPGHGNPTPLLEALAAANRVTNHVEYRLRPPRLMIVSDGKQHCGGTVEAYDSPRMAGKVRETFAPAIGTSWWAEFVSNVIVSSRISGATIALLGDAAKDAGDAQASFDRIFTRQCRATPPAPPPAPATPSTHPFPDVVAVGRDHQWSCSGVVVGAVARAPRAAGWFVLTAKHCLPATEVTLVATSTVAAPVVAVAEAIPHPDPTIDLALLRLARSVARPTHAMRTATDRAAPAGVVRVVGLGADDPTGQHGAGDLHVVELPANGWGCDARSRDRVGCVPGTELAVRGNGGNDACRGDSGAPLFERAPCGWRLIGIASRAIASAHQACGDGGIYTRIDALAPWIEATVVDATRGGTP